MCLQFVKDQLVQKYLYDLEEGEIYEQQFFYDVSDPPSLTTLQVIATLKHDLCEKMIEDQQSKRSLNQLNEKFDHTILIDEGELAKLEASTQKSKRNGKALYMMQQSAVAKRRYTKPKAVGFSSAVEQQLSDMKNGP